MAFWMVVSTSVIFSKLIFPENGPRIRKGRSSVKSRREEIGEGLKKIIQLLNAF